MAERNLGWRSAHPPIEEEIVQNVEKELGVKFPDEFIECVKKYHGGYPTINRFDYLDDAGRKTTSGLSELLSFDLQYEWNILRENKEPPEEMPKGLVIFGTDGGGGYICFDYRERTNNPPVVFWSHDTPSAETVIPLAHDFATFLAMLYQPTTRL
ncbi:MAG: SMI1/KNR4 family protein [Roseiflexaceae bacterium]